MKEKLPINKDILMWARTSIGLSIDEVAHKINRDVQEVKEWEAGNASPTYSQLENLAHNLYKRPIAVFFFPVVPSEETPKTGFRTLPDTVLNELPPEIVKLYRRARLFQLYLEELYEGQKPVQDSLLDKPALNETSQHLSITNEIRKIFGITIDIQSKWQSPEIAFKKWREVLEAKGIFVFKDAFKNDDYSGFCLYDEKYPIIFVNNSMPDSRQIFTLFHELGHLLLYHTGGIDFRSKEIVGTFQGYYFNIEVSCNSFANEFLVPQDIFDSFQLTISEANFQRLADYFSVSREVILRNYLERGLVDANYYEQMAAKWAEQAKQKEGGESSGNYYYTKKIYLGERYINLVYGKYYQNKITIDNVAEYLNVKVKNLPTFEYVVMEGGRL
jgi:Zn-dependent peptidase ImmA (M78 family)